MAKGVPTRTLNPIPFGDLEPHRFEDLVRQLIYDFRPWKSLEATGRGGADEGTDIRAFEAGTEVDEEDRAPAIADRLWVFQCKREKQFGPKKVLRAIAESLDPPKPLPHGFTIAVACNISKTARDVVRHEMLQRGIQEFFLWAKDELEDMLFQAKNDRLLFAYFGISLQHRRRSLATSLRAEIAIKKQLDKLISNHTHGEQRRTPVLLRDPTDDRYPENDACKDSPPRWIQCYALTARAPGFLDILYREHLAAVTEDGCQWDAIFEYDLVQNEISRQRPEQLERSLSPWTPVDFWKEYIAPSRQRYLKIYCALEFNRIIAIDPLGDVLHPMPHIFVDFERAGDPFAPQHDLALTLPRPSFTG